MRYEILGPLRVVDDGDTFISARKIECLLAALLIRADHLVAADHLIAEIWGDQPPRRATAGLHVYISGLRKFLSRPDRSQPRIVTRPPGYMLALGDDEIDVNDFLKLAERGRGYARGQRHGEAATCFDSALALWRGPVLGDVSFGSMVEAFATWLEEMRMECIELQIEQHLQLGRHRELIGKLYSLTAEFPLRETFYRQLMVALYRSERQADALDAYRSAHRTLRSELGLEPCRALQEIQRAILSADDHLLERAA